VDVDCVVRRQFFNEGSARWQYKGDVNPAW